jgi:hypothetical protein
MQQLLLKQIHYLIPGNTSDDVVIIHHITEDTGNKLQLEIERRNSFGITFERIVL